MLAVLRLACAGDGNGRGGCSGSSSSLDQGLVVSVVVTTVVLPQMKLRNL